MQVPLVLIIEEERRRREAQREEGQRIQIERPMSIYHNEDEGEDNPTVIHITPNSEGERGITVFNIFEL